MQEKMKSTLNHNCDTKLLYICQSLLLVEIDIFKTYDSLIKGN